MIMKPYEQDYRMIDSLIYEEGNIIEKKNSSSKGTELAYFIPLDSEI